MNHGHLTPALSLPQCGTEREKKSAGKMPAAR
jgi:hypothetical protein